MRRLGVVDEGSDRVLVTDVDIVRDVVRRQAPVTSPGPNYPLPLPGGAGKALKPNVRPLRSDVPIYLAAMGPRNVALAAECAARLSDEGAMEPAPRRGYAAVRGDGRSALRKGR